MCIYNLYTHIERTHAERTHVERTYADRIHAERTHGGGAGRVKCEGRVVRGVVAGAGCCFCFLSSSFACIFRLVCLHAMRPLSTRGTRRSDARE